MPAHRYGTPAVMTRAGVLAGSAISPRPGRCNRWHMVQPDASRARSSLPRGSSGIA